MRIPAFVAEGNVLGLLLSAAQQHPQAPALYQDDKVWTYEEPLTRVCALARVLTTEANVSPGDRVGVLSYKTMDCIAAMQAVLLVDGVYVMLDARQPVHRLAAICRDCGISVLMGDTTMDRHRADLRAAGCETFVPLGQHGLIARAQEFADGRSPRSSPVTDLRAMRCGDDLAALLYTSGSTGTPKAVHITHENILSFVYWAQQYFEFTADEVFLNQAHLSFDISTLDVYNALHAGAAVLLADEVQSLFPQTVVTALTAHRVSNVYLVSSALVALMDRGGLLDTDPTAIRRVLYGGEVLPMPDLERLRSWLPADTGLFNVYGPIESNICTVWEVPHGVPLTEQAIGEQLYMTNVSVRDANGDVCAAGDIGEIWVSGPTVSPGYWKRPELDASKFVLADELRWYRTGDLGAADAQGLLTFHGRRDDLVKRRGYRIELGEIESAISTHSRIRECAVVSYEPSPWTVEIQSQSKVVDL